MNVKNNIDICINRDTIKVAIGLAEMPRSNLVGGETPRCFSFLGGL